jgi:uncharacterized membrane protein (DUF106 family)
MNWFAIEIYAALGCIIGAVLFLISVHWFHPLWFVILGSVITTIASVCIIYFLRSMIGLSKL